MSHGSADPAIFPWSSRSHTARTSVTLASLVWLLLLGSAASATTARTLGEPEAAPLVSVLAPHDGSSLNVVNLHVQALVVAFTPHPWRRFVFNGRWIAGMNAGEISHVDIALDGIIVERIERHACRQQLLVDSRIDVSHLADGGHTVTVTAHQGHRRRAHSSATFVLDRTLPLPARNRVEDAATPTPFACFGVNGRAGDDDDRGNPDTEVRPRPGYLELRGSFVPARHSNGLDLNQDRVVIALGTHLTVVEPGSFTCRRSACQFHAAGNTLVRRMVLTQSRSGRWRFRIDTGPGAVPADATTLYLRIGDDWGGFDLRAEEAIVALRPALDTAFQAQALVGPGGGSVTTVDSRGVRIQLEVPTGALAHDTLITLTPLVTSPVANASTMLHPGVKLEPEGLVFAEPATLTLNFSDTLHQVEKQHFVFLLTSPLTTLPLFSSADPAAQTVTALIPHFSIVEGGAPAGSLIDFAEWGNPILEAAGQPTIAETLAALALLAAQQEADCAEGCLDGDQLIQQMLTTYNTLIDAACAEGLAQPSQPAFDKLLELETQRQGLFLALNLDFYKKPCLLSILQVLIDQAGAAASTGLESSPGEEPIAVRLNRLLNQHDTALLLVAPDLALLAAQHLATALRTMLGQGQGLCATNETAGKSVFEAILDFSSVALQVDPTLDADVENAITECGAPTAVVRHLTLVVDTAQDEFWEECSPGNSPIQLDPSGPSLPLPVMAEFSCPAGTVSTNVFRPGDGSIFAVDMTGSASGGSFLALVYVDVGVPGPGSITIDLNPEWQIGGVAAIVSEAAVAGEHLGSIGCEQDASSAVTCNTPNGQPSVAVAVQGPSHYYVGLVVYYGTSAMGRVMTVTFTPASPPVALN